MSNNNTHVRLRVGDGSGLPAIIEGISPEVTLTEVAKGVRMDVTTKSGTKSALIRNGEPGADYILSEDDKEDIAARFNYIKQEAEAAAEAADTSASEAATSAEAASGSASAAAASATAAAGSATAAAGSASSASSSASSASSSSAAAAASEANAAASETAAAASEANAADSETAAAASQAAAAASQTAAAGSASSAASSATAASGSATAAAGSASAAAQSATDAQAAATELEDTIQDVANLNSALNTSDDTFFTGISHLLGNWVRGYSDVNTGVIDNINYRVTHLNWLSYPADVVITPASGYAFNVFDSAFNLISATTTNPVTISANTLFRVNIRKSPEDSSVADISAFANALTVSNIFDTTLRMQLAPSDLNDAVVAGNYMLAYGSTYSNDAFGSQQRRYLSVSTLDGKAGIVFQRETLFEGTDYNCTYATRYRTGDGKWKPWTYDNNSVPLNIARVALTSLTTVGVTITYNGKINITGTSTQAGVAKLTDNISLPAGLYSYGLGDEIDGLKLQVRKANDDSAITETIDGCTYGYFYLPTMTTVYLRLYIASGKTFNDSTNAALFRGGQYTEKEFAPNDLNTHTHTIAHRGIPSAYPDASKEGYALAKKLGFLIVEGDVRFTSDGYAVLHHDATYTVNGVTHTIAEETLDQFLSYDLGMAKYGVATSIRGMTLNQFLILCNQLQLFPTIEFKVGTTEQIQYAMNIVKRNRSRVFNYKASLANLKTIIDADETASVRLGADDYSDSLYDELVELINYGNQKHTTHCIYSTYGNWTDAQINKCRDAGAIIGVSSINSNKNLKALTQDVDIIFTENGFNATAHITKNIVESVAT